MDTHAALEATMGTIEETLDVIESVPAVVKNNPLVLAGVAVVSIAVGAGVATLIANKRLKTKYEQIAEQEIADAKVYYQKKNKTGDYADPIQLAERIDAEEAKNVPFVDSSDEEIAESYERQGAMVKTAQEIAEKQGYTAYDKPVGNIVSVKETEEGLEVKASIKKNVFDAPLSAEERVYDAELESAKRENGEPYIVLEADFFHNDREYSQTTLTFFEGDDVLAAEDDSVMQDYVPIIGSDNLKFGYGSKSNNVVYIRNDRLQADYEVTRSRGTYSHEVLGLMDEPEDRSPRKFRNTD